MARDASRAASETIDVTAKSLGAAFDSLGKVTAGVAGLGGLAYLTALAVTAIRLHHYGLPSLEALSALPRDQLVVGGIVELTITLAVAGALAWLVVVAIRGADKVSLPQVPLSRRKRSEPDEEHPARGVLIVLLLAAVLLAPFSWAGMAWSLITVGLVALLFLRKTPPVGQILLVAALAAVLLTIMRQVEFTSPFAQATMAIKVEQPGRSQAATQTISGRYIGESSDDIILGVKDQEAEKVEKLLRTHVSSSLVLIPRDRVEQLALKSTPSPTNASRSIADRALGIPLSCLVPTCQTSHRSFETPQ